MNGPDFVRDAQERPDVGRGVLRRIELPGVVIGVGRGEECVNDDRIELRAGAAAKLLAGRIVRDGVAI